MDQAPTSVTSYPFAPVESGSWPGGQVLRKVSSEATGDSERITFVFEPLPRQIEAVTTYMISSAEPPFMFGASGETVSVAGDSFLLVEFRGAFGYDPDGTPGTAGAAIMDSLDLHPMAGGVSEIVQLDDFEGYLVWVVGIAGRSRWQVSDLTGPSRLVLDVIPILQISPARI